MKRLIAFVVLAGLVLSVAAVGASASGQWAERATPPEAVEAADAPAAAPAMAPAAEPATGGDKTESEDNTHLVVLDLPLDAQSVQARRDSEAQDVTCPGKEPCGE